MASDEKDGFYVRNGILKQFASTWKMLRKAIENVPEEYWYRTDKDWTFSYNVYHIIETQEFYMRNDPEGMEWGKLLRGAIDDEKIPNEKKYPSKEVLIEYSEKMEKEITEFLNKITLEELIQKDGFKWFDSIHDKLLYLLRHNAHHLGELGRMLREWDCERMRWQ